MLQKIQKTIYPYITIIWLGSTVLVSWIIWYIFHPVMVRFLSDIDFVHLQFLMSLMNILAVVWGLSLFVTQEVLTFDQDIGKEFAFVQLLIWRFQKALPWMFWCCVIVAFLLSYAFPITNFLIVLLCTMAIISWVLSSLLMWVIRAKKEYTKINILSVLWASIKLLLAWGMVWLGRGIWWAVWGVVWASICMSWVVCRYIYSIYTDVDPDPIFAADISHDLSSYIWPLLTTSWVVFLITLLTNLDILLISNVLEAKEAAIYSSLSLVAKFVFFVCAAIEVYFYNNIIWSKNLSRSLLLRPLWVYIVMWVCWVVGIGLLGGRALDLFKPWLSSSLEFLPMLFIFFLSIWVVSLYSKILVAWKQYTILRYMWAIVLFFGGYILTQVGTITDVLAVMKYIWWALLLVMWIYVYIWYQRYAVSSLADKPNLNE